MTLTDLTPTPQPRNFSLGSWVATEETWRIEGDEVLPLELYCGSDLVVYTVRSGHAEVYLEDSYGRQVPWAPGVPVPSVPCKARVVGDATLSFARVFFAVYLRRTLLRVVQRSRHLGIAAMADEIAQLSWVAEACEAFVAGAGEPREST